MGHLLAPRGTPDPILALPFSYVPTIIDEKVELPSAEVTAHHFRHVDTGAERKERFCINSTNTSDQPLVLTGTDDWGLSTPNGDNVSQLQAGARTQAPAGELAKGETSEGVVCFDANEAPDTTDYIVTFNKSTNADGNKPAWRTAYNK